MWCTKSFKQDLQGVAVKHWMMALLPEISRGEVGNGSNDQNSQSLLLAGRKVFLVWFITLPASW